ncbi:MAG: MFS transporter [Desulfobacterales bacterium]|nr:MFS transporter [Desulfobacterales bacterium]MCP4161313.1 MFS transporter [Deltaproteobacteria bacterium]
MKNKNNSIFVLNICAFLLMVGVGIVVPTLPQKVLTISDSHKDVGYLASFFAVTYILFQIPIGNLADRFGFKIFLFFGYLFCGLSGCLYYYSDTTLNIYIARSIHGLGEVPVWSLAPAMMTISSKNKGKLIGLYNASIHLGLTIGAFGGFFLGDLLINEHFLFLSIISLISSVLILMFIKNPIKKKDIVAKTNIKKSIEYISDPSIFIVFCGIALYGMCYGTFFTIIPSFLIKSGNGKEFISIFFALFYLVISISQVTAGPLSDYNKKRDIMVTGLLVSGICIFLFHRFSNYILLLLISTGGLGLGIFYVSSQTFINESVSKSLKGTISGLYYFFWGIGFFSGPVFIGFVSDMWGVRVGMNILSLIIIILSVAIFSLLEKKGLEKKKVLSV